MLTYVSISYSASVRIKPERTVRDASLRASVPVEIREFTSAQAPVALTFSEDGRAFSYRDVGGQFFQERDSAPSDARRWLDDLASSPAKLGDVFGRPYVERDQVLPETTPNLVVKRGDREEAFARIAAVARNMALVDGRLWTRAMEPRLQPELYPVVDGAMRVDVRVEYEAMSTPHEFRLDQAHLVAAFLRASHPGIDVLLSPTPFELKDATLVRHPCDAFTLSDAGYRLMSDATPDALKQDLDYLERFVGLRDALAATGLPDRSYLDMGTFSDVGVTPEKERVLRVALERAAERFPARDLTKKLTSEAILRWDLKERDRAECHDADTESIVGMAP